MIEITSIQKGSRMSKLSAKQLKEIKFPKKCQNNLFENVTRL